MLGKWTLASKSLPPTDTTVVVGVKWSEKIFHLPTMKEYLSHIGKCTTFGVRTSDNRWNISMGYDQYRDMAFSCMNIWVSDDDEDLDMTFSKQHPSGDTYGFNCLFDNNSNYMAEDVVVDAKTFFNPDGISGIRKGRANEFFLNRYTIEVVAWFGFPDRAFDEI